jgi:hypothetical protein
MSEQAPNFTESLAAALERFTAAVETGAGDDVVSTAMFEFAVVAATQALRMSGAPNWLTATSTIVDEPDATKRRISVVAQYVVGESPADAIASVREENRRLRRLLDERDRETGQGP